MNDATVIRAFELPLQRAEADLDVWPLIREAWQQAGMLANWCARHLLASDAVRMPGMERLPRQPRVNLYGDAGKAFGLMERGSWWAGAAGSFSAVVKNVQDYWTQHRYAVLWKGEERPPFFASPYPFPIRGQEWREAGFHEGRPFVVVNLPSGTPRKPVAATLRLRSGPEFGRQLALFRQVVEGTLPRVQLVIREQGCSRGCHRPVMPGREPSRVMVKMVARLPVRVATGQRTLTLTTEANRFWTAEIDKRHAWSLNNDHMRRACQWLAIHEERRQRLAEDRKAERRLNPGTDHWRRSLERCCAKHERRMASWLHETAAHLTGFAVRNRVGLVLYNDEDQGFAPLFPWFKLKALLKDKLKAEGIECYCRSDGEFPLETVIAQTPSEDEECLRSMDENVKAGKRLLKARRRSRSQGGESAASATART